MLNLISIIMKQLSLVFLCAGLLLLTACNSFNSNTNKADETLAIENVLDQWVTANETEDFDLIQKIWAPDSDIILFGTDSDEKLMGWVNIKNAIKEQYEQIDETYISVYDQFIKISNDGSTAWFAEFLNYNFVYQGEAKSFEGLRFTGILEKQQGEWKIVQAHLSMPAHDIIEQ